MECLDHLEFTGRACPDCGLAVDGYGNTEDSFKFCSFPDCGCDGARLCMAGDASARSVEQNVEGMYQRKDREAMVAKMKLVGSVFSDNAQRRER